MEKEQEKLFSMIEEMVEHELDMMDLEGLYDFANDQLWKHFDSKSPQEIRTLYEEYMGEDLVRVVDEENWQDHKDKEQM